MGEGKGKPLHTPSARKFRRDIGPWATSTTRKVRGVLLTGVWGRTWGRAVGLATNMITMDPSCLDKRTSGTQTGRAVHQPRKIGHGPAYPPNQGENLLKTTITGEQAALISCVDCLQPKHPIEKTMHEKKTLTSLVPSSP